MARPPGSSGAGKDEKHTAVATPGWPHQPERRLSHSFSLHSPLLSALYQLQLVPTEEARKHIPADFKIVSLFG